MARRCELTGKGVLVGHHVSHANNKTKRVFRPNLQEVSLASEALGQDVRLKISMSALRSIDRSCGFDAFLLKSKDAVLSARALRLKRMIAKKAAAVAGRLEAADEIGRTFGHPPEEVFQTAADRRHPTVGQSGAEEGRQFAVVRLPVAGSEGQRIVGEKVRAALPAEPIEKSLEGLVAHPAQILRTGRCPGCAERE